MGGVADKSRNRKGRGDTAVLAAFIEIAGEEHLVFAVVEKRGKQKYYLHEVAPVKRNAGGSFQIPRLLPEGGSGRATRQRSGYRKTYWRSTEI